MTIVRRSISYRSIALLGIALFIGCSTEPQPKVQDLSDRSNELRVVASYYGEGDGFHGKKTASGERFDPEEFTAAHKTYPFGTKLKVTNPKTGKSVQVRVNDRGPFVKGRSLDLSAAAARSIGLDKDGEASLIVEKVE